MKTSNSPNHRLNQIFVGWMVVANAALIFAPLPAAVDHWLGGSLLWALLIPATCLIWLNPRRSWGLLLATAGTLVWIVLLIGKRLLAQRPTMASVTFF